MRDLIYAVEAWTVPEGDEPFMPEMERAEEFRDPEEAMRWACDRLEEGYAVRAYRR